MVTQKKNKKILNAKVCSNDYKKCLVKYIANHTSGISDFIDCPKKSKILKKYEDMEGTKSRKKVANLMLKMKPFYKPNSKYEYSNIGYGILGHIIEKLTKMKYYEFIDKYVFEPLNIKAKYGENQGKGFADGHYYFWQFKNSKYTPLKKKQHYNAVFEAPAGTTFINPLDFKVTKFLDDPSLKEGWYIDSPTL